MDLLYPDYNCFQRGFDDPSQVRIRMEALACEEIFLMAEDKRIKLLWSFMHEDGRNLEMTIINPIDYIRREAK